MTLPRLRTLAAVAALAGTAALTACSSSGGGAAAGPSSTDPSSAGGPVSGAITVFAASSLQEAFTTLGQQFQKAHPGTTVTFDFDSSSTLAQQITQGAPADVFASASTTNMTQVTDAKDAGTPTDFVSNVMEIAVPPGNPGHVHGVADLARSSVTLAVCEPQVPCGATAAQVFTNAEVSVTPVTQEPDVKSTLEKVELNEVDAGMVYVTDVRAAGAKVTGIPIPDAVNAKTTYPIATLTHATNPATAAAFVAYVLSPAGRAVLTADGFERP